MCKLTRLLYGKGGGKKGFEGQLVVEGGLQMVKLGKIYSSLPAEASAASV